MSLPYCKEHNVSWATGKDCPDCIVDRLQARVKELENINKQTNKQWLESYEELESENVKLHKVVDAVRNYDEMLGGAIDHRSRWNAVRGAIRELDAIARTMKE